MNLLGRHVTVVFLEKTIIVSENRELTVRMLYEVAEELVKFA